ncbi:DnaJ domain-containing protein [Mycena latifolia]|nr:DnaJ domain-containing protein [Mycena latifolia]
MSRFPDYYKLLNVPKSASHDEIRTAYKKESLRTHPDRIANATPAEKKKATEKFQVGRWPTAYYVLSDATRRREYDALYTSRTKADRTDDPGSSNSFSQFSGMFGGSGAAPAADTGERPDANGVFADTFEELAWCCCRRVTGLYYCQLPRSNARAVAECGGCIHDLGGNQKAEILRALAMKVLGSAL